MPVPTITWIQPAANEITPAIPTVQIILSDTGGGALGIDLATVSVMLYRVGEWRTLVSGGVIGADGAGIILPNATLGYDLTVRPTADLADARWYVAAAGSNLTADAFAWLRGFTAWEEETPAEDHATFAAANLLAQYADATRLKDTLAILMGEIQNAEDLTYEMLAERSVYTAIGVQLDTLGVLVGQGRIDPYAAIDEIYRLFLLARIMVNKSDGRWSQLLAVLERVGIYEPIGAREYYPATIQTECTAVIDATYAAAIWEIVQDAGPAGVRWDFVWSTYSESDVFTLSSQIGTNETDIARGTSNLAGTTGGRMSGMLT
jgi:hypothetical protein